MSVDAEAVAAENARLRAALQGGVETRIISAEEAAELGIKGTQVDDPSGTLLAQRAREAAAAAGVDTTTHAEVANFDITLQFVYRGDRETAEKLRDDLLFALLQMPAVQQPISNSVAERVIGVPVNGATGGD